MVKILEDFNFTSWESNSYILYDDCNCVLIDPNLVNSKLEDFIITHNLNLKAIILTHGHFDHITGVDYFFKKYKCDVFIHKYDEELLNNTYKNCSWMVNQEITSKVKPILLNDNDTISLLDEPIKVIHTPYHTDGSVCFYIEKENILISGDTLFNGGMGRADLPTGSPELIESSLNKLKKLPKNTIVYPGHGPKTTIEKEFNKH